MVRLGARVKVGGKKGTVVTIYTDGRSKDIEVEFRDGRTITLSKKEVKGDSNAGRGKR